MRGLLFQGTGLIEYREDLPDPIIESPTDAVITVARSGLCGSDLHTYEGREAARPGVVPGHEAVGTIVALGDEVRDFSVGDHVVVPFTTSCGVCRACLDGLSARCEVGQLFGWGDPTNLSAPALHGGQASKLRVPQADGTLVPVPEGVSDDGATLLTDNLPTGWFAAFDPVDDRLARAVRLGGTPLKSGKAVEVPAVVEAAGVARAQALAFESVRPGGTLSVIAVQTDEQLPFSPIEAYDKNVTVRFGRAPVRSVLDRLLPALADGRLAIPEEVVVTHPAESLSDGADLYRRFAKREPGLVKALFAP
jgi:threonine dehydrogenase-like Zn-dependent dehydrogenase